MFNWTWTLKGGAVSVTTPLLYVFAFLFLFVFGGMTGVAVAAMSLDVHWHDTYFVVAHFHFIMVGGTLTAFLAALHYWFPKMTGPHLLGAPRHALGGADLRRILRHVLSPVHPWQWRRAAPLLQLPAPVPGAARRLHGRLVGARARLVIVASYLFHALRYGARAGANPWGSRGFEWRTPSPPPSHNFHEAPDLVRIGAYDYTQPLAGEEEP